MHNIEVLAIQFLPDFLGGPNMSPTDSIDAYSHASLHKKTAVEFQ